MTSHHRTGVFLHVLPVHNPYMARPLICVNAYGTDSNSMAVEKTIHRGYVMGFPHSPAKEQVKVLVGAGCRARDIYGEGQDADFAALIRALRRGQVVGTAGGFRVFGESRRQMMAAHDAIEEKGGIVLDVESGDRSDRRGAQMLHHALSRVHGGRTMYSGAPASERARLGGIARKSKIHAKRMPIAEARALWFNMAISGDEAVERAGPGWSKGTMNRTFGESGRPKGPAKPRKK